MPRDQIVSVSRVIDAPAERIFDVLADPSQHPALDGSGTVRRYRGEPQRLKLGSRFGMGMHYVVPYRIKNTVVEFEDGRLIAWRHFGGHRWRFELKPDEGGATRVTESFDWSTAVSPKFIELAGYPRKHVPNMEATLQRLAAEVEAPAP
jgi:uncharacterized protein YndB with AHSA1/START domain